MIRYEFIYDDVYEVVFEVMDGDTPFRRAAQKSKKFEQYDGIRFALSLLAQKALYIAMTRRKDVSGVIRCFDKEPYLYPQLHKYPQSIDGSEGVRLVSVDMITIEPVLMRMIEKSEVSRELTW